MEKLIVFAMGRMTPPFFWGGAEKSNLTLALKLLNSTKIQPVFFGSYTHYYKETNHLNQYLEYLDTNNIGYKISSDHLLSYRYKDIECVMSTKNTFLDSFEKYLSTITTSKVVVVTMLEFASEVIMLCDRIGLDVYLWVMDTFEAGLKPLEESDYITGVFATSQYVKDEIWNRFEVESEVLHPMFHSEWYLVASTSNKQYITMINPIPEKGIDIFLEIVFHMPELEFLIVDGWRPVDLNLPENVMHWTRCIDVKVIYAQTQLLLVPSVWPEAFGRVVVESGINGIPAIVSDVGGLREAVGNGGMLIKNYRNVSEWIKAITYILEPNIYPRFSELARQNAQALQNVDWTSHFAEIIFSS